MKKNLWSGKKAYYGKPAQLFRDSDKDGVPNVFDCKPNNRRRQDVILPGSSGGLNDMYARQEAARQNKLYQKMLEDLRRQEEQRLAELSRIQGETSTIVVDNTGVVYKDNPFVFDTGSGSWVPLSSKAGQRAASSLSKPTTTQKSGPITGIGTSTKGVTYVSTGKTTYDISPTTKPSQNKTVFQKVTKFFKK